MTITVEQVKTTFTMREAGHLNGGKVFFGYLHRCVQEPRLVRTDKYFKADRSVVSTWSVDGVKVADLEAAVAALNIPPVLTPEEEAALAQIGDEFADHRKTIGWELLWTLRDKGQIEYGKPGHCRKRRT